MAIASAVEAQRTHLLSRILSVSGIATILWMQFVLVGFIDLLRNSFKLSFVADDALRLVEVRDLLAGQPWFDLRNIA